MPSSGSSYYIPTTDAKALVARGDGYWDGPKRVIRTADTSKRGLWVPVGKSAFYSAGQGFGPKFCTLQLT